MAMTAIMVIGKMAFFIKRPFPKAGGISRKNNMD
jgi:hypothetical protein